jgi:hypothetical protein
VSLKIRRIMAVRPPRTLRIPQGDLLVRMAMTAIMAPQ